MSDELIEAQELRIRVPMKFLRWNDIAEAVIGICITEEDMSDEPADAWTKERDRMLDEIAAKLDPAYVDLVAELKPILDENMRLREALTKIADAGTFGYEARNIALEALRKTAND